MNDKILRIVILSISYIAALVLLIIYLKPVLQAAANFFNIFDPFFIGMIIAFILNRPCMLLDKLLSEKVLKNRRAVVTRYLSITILYLFVAVLLIIGISYLLPALIGSIQDLLKNIGTYSDNLQTLIDKVAYFFGFKKSINMSDMFNWTAAYADKLAQSITVLLNHLINLTSEGMAMIARFLFSIAFSVYFLAGKERLLSQGEKLFGHYLPEKIYRKSSEVYHVVVDIFGRYFIGQIIEASILGLLCFAGMLAFGFEYPVLISALIGITSLVPMVGPYIGCIIAFRILVMIDPVKAILFVVFIIVLQQLEGYFIYPRIVGKAIGLQSIWVMLSILIGASLGGVTGIVVAVPVAAVIYTLIRRDITKEA